MLHLIVGFVLARLLHRLALGLGPALAALARLVLAFGLGLALAALARLALALGLGLAIGNGPKGIRNGLQLVAVDPI